MNPMQMMQAFKNPQQFIQGMMNNNQVMSNPMAKNVMEMAQKGNIKGIEEVGRNLCKEKGIDPEKMISGIKSQFGM